MPARSLHSCRRSGARNAVFPGGWTEQLAGGVGQDFARGRVRRAADALRLAATITTGSSKDSKRNIPKSKSPQCLARQSARGADSRRTARREVSPGRCQLGRQYACTTRFTRPTCSTRSSRRCMLPEVVDQSKWYEGEHRYIDPEKRYIFAFVANSQSGQIVYNLKQVNPARVQILLGSSESEVERQVGSRSIRRASAWARRCSFSIIIPSSARRFSRNFTAKCKSRSAATRAR